MGPALLGGWMCLLAGAPAGAGPIATLFNTGIDSAGAVLGNGSADPHWTVISGPAGAATATAGDRSGGLWVGPDTRSQWISGGGTGRGSFDYRTTFNLSGLDPTSASIGGSIAADNEITDLLINGQSTGFKLGTAGSPAYTSFERFNPLPTFRAGFVAGSNTIDVLVYNDAVGPQGLRLELTGSAQPLPIPEPASLALLGIFLSALAPWRRRRGPRSRPADPVRRDGT